MWFIVVSTTVYGVDILYISCSWSISNIFKVVFHLNICHIFKCLVVKLERVWILHLDINHIFLNKDYNHIINIVLHVSWFIYSTHFQFRYFLTYIDISYTRYVTQILCVRIWADRNLSVISYIMKHKIQLNIVSLIFYMYCNTSHCPFSCIYFYISDGNYIL